MEKPILRMPKNNDFDGIYSGNILGSREEIEQGLKEAREKLEKNKPYNNPPGWLNHYKGFPVFYVLNDCTELKISFFDLGLEELSKNIKKSKEEIKNTIISELTELYTNRLFKRGAK